MTRQLDKPLTNKDFDAVAGVNRVIRRAIERGSSDIHFEPTADGYELRLRIDGLLQADSTRTTREGRSMVTRLMVMAHLLTYRLDIPQEGRIEFESFDLRLAIMPTTHGLRAAIRMPAELIQPRSMDELSLSPQVLEGLKDFAACDAGMLVVTGPAGSGKTTTIYALLDYISRSYSGLSIITLEDPVERDIRGVTQIEVSPFGQLTYERALRSILRQDPQVLMLGEIRDVQTASLAVQAALSGHRLICTLHAGSPGGAIARLLEMGLEPFRLTSAVRTIISQRLLRRVREDGSYSGRVPVAEIATMTDPLRRGIIDRLDAAQLQSLIAARPDYIPLREAAEQLRARAITTAEEIGRVLGPEKP